MEKTGKKKKWLIFLGVVAVIVVICVLMSLRPVENYAEKYANSDLSRQVAGLERTGTYKDYLDSHADAQFPDSEVVVDITNYTSEGEVRTADAAEISSYKKSEGVSSAVFTGLNSKVSFNVNVSNPGFYNLYIEYAVPESHGVPAERSVIINDVVPFEDAQNISLTRIWKDGGEKKVDNQGNEIRPSQVEEFSWQSTLISDDRGYESAPYKFYFDAGVNTITFGGENEPLLIGNVKLVAVNKGFTYADYVQQNAGKASNVTGFEKKIQGEDSTFRSESSLYAKFDRSSPTTEPNSVTYTKLNYVGGDAWKTNGQWIEWPVTIEQDGFYEITIKARQNYSRGNVSNRKIYIDGEVPFDELNAIKFIYDNDWQYMTLGDDDGNAYQFYLTAGEHTIRMEATLGELGAILTDMEDCTFRLNQIYRRLLVYTGASPDQYRDYHIETSYPEVIDAMDIESKRLFKIVDDMVAYSGQKAESIATCQTVALQLERFVNKPQKITTEFTTFKDNVTAIGTSALTLSESKLDVDFLVVSSPDVEIEKKKANVFTKLWHEAKSFVASYFVDYNAVGDVYSDNGEVIKVWVMTGRDQGTILKSLIDDDFTPNTGIPVNVEIVDAGALLNAVMSGNGPNVALTVGSDQPVNYALRGASVDLTQFPDWQEVFSYYYPSSYKQYELLDETGYKHIYGVPETQTFNVMFYRKDILEELELEVPQTWKELIEMLPTIQGNNLSVGLPSAAGSSSTGAASTALMSNNPDLTLYFTLLFQNGGDMYNEKGTKTTVNDEAGMKAIDDYIRYFNDYGLPTVYDFVTRFRSGEMPIGIAPYSTYNTLQVSAPEIRGLWEFTLIPGTEKYDENGDPILDENGEIYLDRSDCIAGAATMMLTTDSEVLKNNSWEFMKWWAKPETQINFGREIEALLGSSARYATANTKAFSSLSWSAKDIAVLEEQWSWTKGISEVPGGYFTGRHITNAIRKVINTRCDTREAIIDYSILIDEEIVKKRKEFGLPIDD
ncbi:MAG: extracellular solute-binding protein [Lachnospiraceae bacterium]|nr:extracellular solute-binding protein [Lachnospiraceae bacterium]